jgi:hypothetical protein
MQIYLISIVYRQSFALRVVFRLRDIKESHENKKSLGVFFLSKSPLRVHLYGQNCGIFPTRSCDWSELRHIPNDRPGSTGQHATIAVHPIQKDSSIEGLGLVHDAAISQ